MRARSGRGGIVEWIPWPTGGLFPGTHWSEDAIGTNAMGTTLAVDAPVQIHSAEHLVRTYHTWTCVAAPVHDPDTGGILGAIIAYKLETSAGIHSPFAVGPLVVVAAGILGFLCERLLLRPLKDHGLSPLIVTIGINLLLLQLAKSLSPAIAIRSTRSK